MKIGNPALLNNLDLNYLQRRIFQLVIIFYPINYLPLNLPLVGGSLPLLFLLIGYFTFIVELIIRPVIFTKQEKIGILFLLISSLWYLITALIGVESYQYYHFIDITQNEKLQMLFLEINKWGSYDSLLVIKGWLAFLGIRSAVLDTLFAYSITLWFYHIYKSDFKKAFQDTFKAIKILCLIISLYSLVEVGYLLGNEFCKYVLVTINPLFMKIAYLNDWWPPLLWPNLQARSLFAEPSFFGMYLAMALPFLANSFWGEEKYKTNKFSDKLYIIIYVFMVMLLIMSKARTAIALISGEVALIILWQLCIHRKLWRKFLIFLGSTILAVCLGLLCTFQFQSIDTKVSNENNTTIQSYTTKNVTSIVGTQRSNNARLANTLAMAKVGLNNPIFGVGQGLVHEYVSDQLTVEDLNNPEVKKWANDLKKMGPLKAGYPILNQLSWVFAGQGIIGLLIFLFPVGFIIKSIFPLKHILHDFQTFSVFVAFCGLVMAFFSNAAQLGYYILCGLMLCLISYKSSAKDD